MGGHSQSIEISFAGSTSSDEYSIPSGGRIGISDRFAQAAFHLVPDHRIADPLADDETVPVMVKVVRQQANHQQAVGRAAPLAMNFGDSLLTAEPVTFLHRTHAAGDGTWRIKMGQGFRRTADAGP